MPSGHGSVPGQTSPLPAPTPVLPDAPLPVAPLPVAPSSLSSPPLEPHAESVASTRLAAPSATHGARMNRKEVMPRPEASDVPIAIPRENGRRESIRARVCLGKIVPKSLFVRARSTQRSGCCRRKFTRPNSSATRMKRTGPDLVA